MSGKVVVDGNVLSKPGVLISSTAHITIRGLKLRYASKGGYKLRHALTNFNICVANHVCLDAGASTGGFTDCLLQSGASFVHSVEVGFGQLRGELAQDPRVRSLERTNISDIDHADLRPPISLAVADLSYLSLRKSIPVIRSLFPGDDHRIVFLVKPLYEGLKQVDKCDLAEIRKVLSELLTELQSQHHHVCNLCVSPLLGGRGAIEFLGYIDGHSPACDPDRLVQLAMTEALRSPPQPIQRYIEEAAASTVRL
jgi:23S rRNA (cytidine1920-2'-O)/16S rRNA (cytidine1409-2'-O)-methyltransferase